MTVATTHHVECDLCGETVYGPDRRTYSAGHIQAMPDFSHAQFRLSYNRPYDLCEACATPLIEALQERIFVLQAEGRIRSAA